MKKFIRDYAVEKINILHTLMFVQRFASLDGEVVRQMEVCMMDYIILMQLISESTKSV